jgi:hypothetical protein
VIESEDVDMNVHSRRLRRWEASQYLKDQWGIERAPATLAKLAVIGGGPCFEKAGRVPLYSPEFLDAWALSLLSPPLASTSDQGSAGHGSRR